jgi:hypothetical protein
MNPREQFEKETGMTTGIMFAHSVGFRDEYVLWLEKELSNLGFAEPIKQSNPEPTTEELKPCGENYFKKDGQCYKCLGVCIKNDCSNYSKKN